MATPAYIAIFHNNKPLPGLISLHDHQGEEGKKSCTRVLELSHRVWTVKDYWEYCIHYYSRAHADFSVTIPLNNIAPQLHQFLCRQTFLSKVEVYLYQFDKKARKEIEYFRVTMEHVLVSRCRLRSPNTKTPGFEKYDPMLDISLRYQRITWLNTRGYIIHTDEWEEAFDPGEKKDFSPKSAALVEAAVPLALLKINPRKLKIEEPEEGLEIGKPFETKLDSLLSRAPKDNTERVVWLSLWSKYKGKVCEMHIAEDAKVDDKGNALVRSPRLPENPDWKNDTKKSPDEPVEYWWRAESKYMDGYFEGEKVMWPRKKKLPKIPVFVDCHMHTNPPKGAPLPTVWAQHWLLKWKTPDWEKMESGSWKTLLEKFKHDLPGLADKDAEQLGQMVLDESEKVLKDSSLNEIMAEPGERKRILVNMPIDIEMAHYWGYDGRPVYEQNEKGELGYWKYSGKGQKDRVWEKIPSKKANKLSEFSELLEGIQCVIKKHKGNFLTFFPIDPRHWQGKISTESIGILEDAFKFLIQFSDDTKKLKNLSAIGFKLYTALGYRPDDYKPRSVTSHGKIPERKTLEAKLPDLADFYTACESNNIPITCHCARGGIFAHDFMLYYDYLFGGDDASQKDKLEFFHHHYVSPFAWENVLKDYKDLHLCLAHFGGEDEWETEELPWAEKCAQLASDPKYPNLYVDLSYFTFKSVEYIDCYKANCDETSCAGRGSHVKKTNRCPVNGEVEIPVRDNLKKMLGKYPKLKEKMLFGTDWYLIGAEEAKYGRYEQYFTRSIKILSEIDKELPAYTMSINPKRFLKLDNVADLMVKKLGQEFGGLKAMVEQNMHDEIGKYYV